MPIFQQSTLTFNSAKSQIAEQVGKSASTEMLARAGRALQHTFRKLNRQNWKRYLAGPTTLTISSGRAALPYNFRDAYTVRLAGSLARPLVLDPRRNYDSSVWSPTTGTPASYNLFRRGGTGYMEFFPTPGSDITATVTYYRRLTVPCSVVTAGTLSMAADASGSAAVLTTTDSDGFAGATLGSAVRTAAGAAIWDDADLYVKGFSEPGAPDDSFSTNAFASGLLLSAYNSDGLNGNATLLIGGDDVLLDIPEDWEDAVLADATFNFLIGAGGVTNDKIAQWARQAAETWATLKHSDTEEDDRELVIQPSNFPAHPPGWNSNLML